MNRFLGVICCFCSLAIGQTLPATDPTPEAATRPDRERRDRAAEVLKVLGPVNFKNEADGQRVVEVVERQILGDSRLMPCDLHFAIVKNEPELDGYCLLAEQKATVLADLRRVGLTDVTDHVAVGALDDPQPYATVGDRATSVTAKPDRHSEQVTVWPAGASIYLLARQGDTFLALGPDGYGGYVSADGIDRVSQLQKRESKPPIHAAEIETAIANATKLLGTKYVWGGIDETGVDCSGLTRCAFESIGINLPRDADQQALTGRLTAVRWSRDGLARGDLIFFAGRRGTISHVAIYLGDQRFLEAADGKVQYSSFDPKSPEFRQKRVDSFCFGKRILE